MNNLPASMPRENLPSPLLERVSVARDEIMKFLAAAGLKWSDQQVNEKAILSAQAWNEIPVDALPAACLEARRTTERGVPMDSEVIRAHRRLTNSKPLPGPVRYQSGQVDMNYHERLAAHAAKCRGEVHRPCKEGDRMISAASGLPLRNMKYADTLKYHHDTIQKAMRQVSGYPIHIDPSPFKTVEQIVSDVRYMKLTTGVDIIFVDYLQYLQVPEAYRGRRIEEVNHISNALKGAAKQLDIPIVVLASMSRFEKEAERKPRPSDLRESGQIESDAHCAILLYRDPKNKVQDPELMELIIGKHRAGPEEPVLLDFYKSICTFTEASAATPEGRY